MFTKKEQIQLAKMNALFTQLEETFLAFEPETQEKIQEYHNDEGSLPYCIRWGMQGTEELLKEK